MSYSKRYMSLLYIDLPVCAARILNHQLEMLLNGLSLFFSKDSARLTF